MRLKMFSAKAVQVLVPRNHSRVIVLELQASMSLIFSLIMLENGFLAASANIENIDPEAENIPILREKKVQNVNRVMSNSFGFGGTNSTIIVEKYTP